MTLTVVDIERLVSDFLRSHASITALATRVVGKTPDATTTSWIRVTEIAGGQVNQPDRLAQSMIQFDAYSGAAGGQPEVNNLYRAIRAALGDLPGTQTLGVVTGVEIIDVHRDVDTDFEPARDLRTVTALVWNHP